MVVAKSDTPKNSAESRPPTPSGMPPQVAMLQMANAYRVSQAIYVAAKLGIADLLANGEKSVSVLAEATQTHPQSLYRVLRALSSLGIFAETEPGTFMLTKRAATLQSDVNGSLRDYAIVIGEPWHWSTWGEISYSVKTGEPGFDRVFGTSPSAYFAQHPDLASRFDQSMVGLLQAMDNGILNGYDFSAFGTIVEVGIPGSNGTLLAQILKQNPNLRGVFFDAASRLELVSATLEAQGVLDRAQLIAGDGLTSLPEGGDVYLLKNLIHDYSDEQARKILSHAVAAMSQDSKLLVVEMIIPVGNAPSVGKIVDIEALMTTQGGYERTEAQYRSLFSSAGLTITNIISTRSPFSILEAARTLD